MRKILDKMFGNLKLSILIPSIFSFVIYLLFVLFGFAENKDNLIIITPISTVICFFAFYFITYFQVKTYGFPEWFLYSFELVAMALSIAGSVLFAVSFVINGFRNFVSGFCTVPIIYAAIALAHSKLPKE